MAAATASFPAPLPSAATRRGICREMESTPCTPPPCGTSKETINPRSHRCQGAPANGEAAARAAAPPRRARGVMSLPSGGRGGAPPLIVLGRCRGRCRTGGGAALPLLRWAALLASRTPLPCAQPCSSCPSRPGRPGRSVARQRSGGLRCAARAVGTEHPSPSGTALRPAPLHPSRELPCAGRAASTHPSGRGLPRAQLRGPQPARRAGAAAPSPAIPGVRRPGAAASSHRR